MQDLTVTIIQTAPAWQDERASLDRFDRLIGGLAEKTDLIALPEMFTTGFTMESERLAASMDGNAVAWMKSRAAGTGAVVAGSLIIEDRGRYFNRFVWAAPDGTVLTYDKRHLFRMADEQEHYAAGDRTLTAELNGWRIRPFICYDLRFPVWMRNRNNEYDIALVVASWPASRSLHWKALLAARAIENQAYCVGVNRTGQDGAGVAYCGDSCIIGPRGDILFQAGDGECVHTARLSRSELSGWRETFPAWKDAD